MNEIIVQRADTREKADGSDLLMQISLAKPGGDAVEVPLEYVRGKTKENLVLEE